MYEIDAQNIETVSGTYRVSVLTDTDSASSPINDAGIDIVIYQGKYETAGDTGDRESSRALDTWLAEYGPDVSEIARRMAKWSALTGDTDTIVIGQYRAGSVSGAYFASIPADLALADPTVAVHNLMDAYQDWLAGDCYGYTVFSPDDEVLESVWGYLGESGIAAALADGIDVATHIGNYPASV